MTKELLEILFKDFEYSSHLIKAFNNQDFKRFYGILRISGRELARLNIVINNLKLGYYCSPNADSTFYVKSGSCLVGKSTTSITNYYTFNFKTHGTGLNKRDGSIAIFVNDKQLKSVKRLRHL